MNEKIKGILFEYEDENTGAIANFHVIEYVGIDYKYGRVSATLNGYVSKKAFNSGRHYLCTHSVTFETDSFEGLDRDWIYRKTVADDSGYEFAGAEISED